jgi:regulator of protease activity HflC (stomatin/prohibitin superfamily)
MNVASIVQILATAAWLLVGGAIVFGVMTAARGGKLGAVVPLVLGAVVLALVLSATAAGLVFVQPEERAIVISALQPKGYREQALQPGLQWIVPFMENTQTYTISRRTYTMSAVSQEGQKPGDDSIQARTKDGQQVSIDASVIYSIDPEKIINLHITWQNRYEDQLVRPTARGIIRDIVSQYSVEEVVSTKRVQMEKEISDHIAASFKDNSLLLAQFVMRDVHFSKEYAAAVEQKQIAEQQALQAAQVVQQRKQEAEQARQVAQGKADATVIASEAEGKAKIIQAEAEAKARLVQADAEAKALKLLADQLKNNPELLQYTYVQKLGDKVQVMLVPSGSPYLFQLPDAAKPVTTTTPAK